MLISVKYFTNDNRYMVVENTEENKRTIEIFGFDSEVNDDYILVNITKAKPEAKYDLEKWSYGDRIVDVKPKIGATLPNMKYNVECPGVINYLDEIQHFADSNKVDVVIEDNVVKMSSSARNKEARTSLYGLLSALDIMSIDFIDDIEDLIIISKIDDDSIITHTDGVITAKGIDYTYENMHLYKFDKNNIDVYAYYMLYCKDIPKTLPVVYNNDSIYSDRPNCLISVSDTNENLEVISNFGFRHRVYEDRIDVDASSAENGVHIDGVWLCNGLVMRDKNIRLPNSKFDTNDILQHNYNVIGVDGLYLHKFISYLANELSKDLEMDDNLSINLEMGDVLSKRNNMCQSQDIPIKYTTKELVEMSGIYFHLIPDGEILHKSEYEITTIVERNHRLVTLTMNGEAIAMLILKDKLDILSIEKTFKFAVLYGNNDKVKATLMSYVWANII